MTKSRAIIRDFTRLRGAYPYGFAAAGFKLAADASFLRSPDDKRDWNTALFAAAAKRGRSDRFVLKFAKP